ncbi:FCD domain-containing protein [Microbacterium sp. HD4P20]|uniref:FadR/GntR family transcriptional regulator n=1 Tax=Microbacterium sp. HD4P20 TaxID=2864874 RepID=UPI001C63F707|nr:FCD domain-containing protein [Microbacterium sp. HD4P20]MCP2635854.1 FCD domain-containing protein [Microbacterium sp. HD4P20]
MPDPLETLVARLLELATIDEDTGRRRLPPERELGDALGMSRGTLREQLAVLERLGFLRRTQGRGTYLETPSFGFVRTYFAIAHSLGYLTDAHVADSRELIEAAVAESAARRATDEQIAGLRESVDRMVTGEAQGDLAMVHAADADFHRRLLRIVDNPILQLLQEGLRRSLQQDLRTRRLSVSPGSTGETFDHAHAEIVDAIAAHDPDAARLAMRRHFEVAGSVASASPT